VKIVDREEDQNRISLSPQGSFTPSFGFALPAPLTAVPMFHSIGAMSKSDPSNLSEPIPSFMK
jgi:hypothetical protein